MNKVGNNTALQRTLITLTVVALILIFAAAVANSRRRAAQAPTPPPAQTELADLLAGQEASGGAGEVALPDSEEAPSGMATSTPAAMVQSVGGSIGSGARIRPLTEAINIRNGPSTSFDVIGTLGSGETALVLARTPANDWYLIQTDTGLTGWVAANVIEFTEGDREMIEVAATIPALPQAATSAPPPPTAEPAQDEEPEPQPPATQPAVTQSPATATAEGPIMKTPTVNPYP